ncbi:Rsp5p-dependent ubiquitination, sorting of cargo proteins at the multivesicular body [Nowakowskiella sp. JEL0078]|nr:Rsp5p-dependent ubiquitination, sorting of cargo proteins at the multivesicular body [Nowakowskiella sp. JEL0078]
MGLFDSCRKSPKHASRDSVSPFKAAKPEPDMVPPVPRIDSFYLASSASNSLRFPTSNFINSPDQSASLSRSLAEHVRSASTSQKSLPHGPPPRSISREAMHAKNFSSATLSSNSQPVDSTVGQPSYEQIRLLHQRGHEAWKFSLEDVDNGMNFTGITVSGNGFTVKYGPQRQGERTVMTNLPLHRDPNNPSRSFYYFETTIKELDLSFPQTVLAIGFATKPYDPDLIDDGSILRDRAQARTAFSTPFGVGQTIGSGYDSFRGNIFFTIDGKWLGNAVTSGIKRPYHGAISANGPAIVTVNVGQTPFKFEAANPPPNLSLKQVISAPEKVYKDDGVPRAPLIMKVSETEQAVVGAARIKNLKPDTQVIEMVNVVLSKEELYRINNEKIDHERRIQEWTNQQQKENEATKQNSNQLYQYPTNPSSTSPVPIITPRGSSRDRSRLRKIENSDFNQSHTTSQEKLDNVSFRAGEREPIPPKNKNRKNTQSQQRENEHVPSRERERNRALPQDRNEDRLQYDSEKYPLSERDHFIQERKQVLAPSREREQTQTHERERKILQDNSRKTSQPETQQPSLHHQFQPQIQLQGTSRDHDFVASRDRDPRSTPDKYVSMYPQSYYRYDNYYEPRNQSPVSRIPPMNERLLPKEQLAKSFEEANIYDDYFTLKKKNSRN